MTTENGMKKCLKSKIKHGILCLLIAMEPLSFSETRNHKKIICLGSQIFGITSKKMLIQLVTGKNMVQRTLRIFSKSSLKKKMKRRKKTLQILMTKKMTLRKLVDSNLRIIRKSIIWKL